MRGRALAVCGSDVFHVLRLPFFHTQTGRHAQVSVWEKDQRPRQERPCAVPSVERHCLWSRLPGPSSRRRCGTVAVAQRGHFTPGGAVSRVQSAVPDPLPAVVLEGSVRPGVDDPAVLLAGQKEHAADLHRARLDSLVLEQVAVGDDCRPVRRVVAEAVHPRL